MIRIGISGWNYPPWRGSFYPRGLPHRKELAYAAEHLSSIEINGTFYALQRPTSFASWHDQTPDDFLFSVKGPRFITHMKKLSDVEAPLANFFASGVLALGRKLGPVLWQLPPNLGYDRHRLSRFFDLLPRTQAAAAELARRHDDKIGEDRALLTSTAPELPIRHALEVRHDTFHSADFPALLREYQISAVLGDNPGKWPIIEKVTTDFMYVRLHGHEELYASGYTDEALDCWATKVAGWHAAGQDVFVYCDNDAKGHAPFDAMNLMSRLSPVR
ncbi:DUF72 domain-containing protein [Microlunatus panaciterrae]|uniref:Uncharacterized protein YecE (DUF72 family) n=1 Tax=Microlunatus panaciterrae TaxID=400768 RepID=A0ABS2RJI7_9ACTN|nr:DUF72 domain-containing protein [Microlunatus panaciterrae]MBM7799170.1 uncharacterized protein YecE (DUF72 family) [Microlunatus panaciterrae]